MDEHSKLTTWQTLFTSKSPNIQSWYTRLGYLAFWVSTILFILLISGGLSVQMHLGYSANDKQSPQKKTAPPEISPLYAAGLGQTDEPVRKVKQTPPDITFLLGSKSDQTQKKQLCLTYLERFISVAKSEKEQFGIPASIILAQGLLETNAGQSRLALKCNNHFGIKCFSKKCKKGHCHNFTDDHHKDFFVVYPSTWASYRAHSKFLKQARYNLLFKLDASDYKAWAKGLKKCGYATDPRYAEKLIAIIEYFELYQYDE
jgi:flagellum-specific peptidoglycan hydrolase FlgJ